MDEPKRARSWKRPIQPRIDLKNDAPVFYSTRRMADVPVAPAVARPRSIGG